MLNIRKDTLDPRFLKTLATKEKWFSDLSFNIIHAIKKKKKTKKTRCVITISNAFWLFFERVAQYKEASCRCYYVHMLLLYYHGLVNNIFI